LVTRHPHLQSTVNQNQATGTESSDDPEDNVFPFPEVPPDPLAGQGAPCYIDPRLTNFYSNQAGHQLQGFPGCHPGAFPGSFSGGVEASTSPQSTIGKHDAGHSQSMVIEGSKSSGKRQSRTRKPNPAKDKDAQDRFRNKRAGANTMQAGEFNKLPLEYRNFVEMRLPEAFQAKMLKGNETSQDRRLHQADAAARTAVVVRCVFFIHTLRRE
jgi:hypothetical protein